MKAVNAVLDRLRRKVHGFPAGPGIYLFKSVSGVTLYVGKALSLRKRTASYFTRRAQEEPKTRAMLSHVSDIEFVSADNEQQALLLEDNFIKNRRPRYNVLLRDDKRYPYLKLTVQETYPRLLMARRPSEDGAKYYGPYPNLRLREILQILHRHFGLRTCQQDLLRPGLRPCLRHSIHQCPGPCAGFITPEVYAKNVQRLRWFLEGKHEELMKFVREEMESASRKREYEEAARLRDLMRAIALMRKGDPVLTTQKKDVDAVALMAGLGQVCVSVVQVRQGRVIGNARVQLDNELDRPLGEILPVFFRQFYASGMFVPDEVLVSRKLGPLGRWSKENGLKLCVPFSGWRRQLLKMAERNVMEAMREELGRAELLAGIQKQLHLPMLPRNISFFDISNLQGSHTVGSAVWFKDGRPEPGRYRKFKIRGLSGRPDDTLALREMTGRYVHLLEREGNDLPDLMMVDGGKGQLNAVRWALQQIGFQHVAVASLAKKEEEVFIPGREKPVDFKGRLEQRHLLQRIRDEAHRFAVSYHRKIRDRELTTSLLNAIPGVGPMLAKRLLKHFGSLSAVKGATVEEISKVPGISPSLAERIHRSFHSK